MEDVRPLNSVCFPLCQTCLCSAVQTRTDKGFTFSPVNRKAKYCKIICLILSLFITIWNSKYITFDLLPFHIDVIVSSPLSKERCRIPISNLIFCNLGMENYFWSMIKAFLFIFLSEHFYLLPLNVAMGQVCFLCSFQRVEVTSCFGAPVTCWSYECVSHLPL